jgi:hypothetical protein
MGQRAIPSWISRHSYHSAEQTVKNKKLDHRVIRIEVTRSGHFNPVFKEAPQASERVF